MIISAGADHGGFELKDKLVAMLRKEGYEVIDNGTNSPDSVDYPDFAQAVARDILEKRADFGLLVCGSGIGISIAANRFKGIRAALVTNDDYARLSRQHNNANIIALGGRFTSYEDAEKWLKIFLSTPFEGGRHERRIEKIDNI
ncbi:ribose 5-phosphate isomerase B [bacterium]|jgi:ribose 5-phosphate isomerase B|nr:ribose 5-phosphate isomerase B [bacterium]